MNVTTRRMAIGSALAGGLGFLGRKSTLAQSQTTANGASIVTTGNVHLGQNASASQTVRGAGRSTGTGIQVTTNDGRIVATGDVWVDQDAAASQDINTTYDQRGTCTPGEVWADPSCGILYYCTEWQNFRTVPSTCSGRCR